MKKSFLTVLISATAIGVAFAFAPGITSKVKTSTGVVKFHSHAKLEDIDATNSQAAAVLDPADGSLAFKVGIRGFEFKNATMQEHFNDNWMESSKFADATFKGKINKSKPADYAKNGTLKVEATGDLTIHGVTKNVTIPGTITIADKEAKLDSKFTVKLADYGIKNTMADKLAEDIEVTVDATLK